MGFEYLGPGHTAPGAGFQLPQWDSAAQKMLQAAETYAFQLPQWDSDGDKIPALSLGDLSTPSMGFPWCGHRDRYPSALSTPSMGFEALRLLT